MHTSDDQRSLDGDRVLSPLQNPRSARLRTPRALARGLFFIRPRDCGHCTNNEASGLSQFSHQHLPFIRHPAYMSADLGQLHASPPAST